MLRTERNSIKGGGEREIVEDSDEEATDQEDNFEEEGETRGIM